MRLLNLIFAPRHFALLLSVLLLVWVLAAMVHFPGHITILVIWPGK